MVRVSPTGVGSEAMIATLIDRYTPDVLVGSVHHVHDHGIDTPVERIGWPDEFVEHGKVDILREKHGITAAAAIKKVVSHLPAKAATA